MIVVSGNCAVAGAVCSVRCMPGASCDNVASSQDFSAARPSDNQTDWLYRPHLWQVSPSATSDDVPSDILDESNTGPPEMKSLEIHKPDYVGKVKIKKSEMGQNPSIIPEGQFS